MLICCKSGNLCCESSNICCKYDNIYCKFDKFFCKLDNIFLPIWQYLFQFGQYLLQIGWYLLRIWQYLLQIRWYVFKYLWLNIQIFKYLWLARDKLGSGAIFVASSLKQLFAWHGHWCAGWLVGYSFLTLWFECFRHQMLGSLNPYLLSLEVDEWAEKIYQKFIKLTRQDKLDRDSNCWLAKIWKTIDV